MEQGRPLVKDDILSLESREDLTAGLVIFAIIALGCVYCMFSAINSAFYGDHGGFSGKTIDYNSGYPAQYSGYSGAGESDPDHSCLSLRLVQCVARCRSSYDPAIPLVLHLQLVACLRYRPPRCSTCMQVGCPSLLLRYRSVFGQKAQLEHMHSNVGRLIQNTPSYRRARKKALPPKMTHFYSRTDIT